MGAGIAQLGVIAGIDTYLHDPFPEALERGGETIHRGLAKGVERERWSEAEAAQAERPPLAARLAKQAVLAAEETAMTAGLDHERRLYELAMATEDRVEGMTAFIEKRKPEFRGR